MKIINYSLLLFLSLFINFNCCSNSCLKISGSQSPLDQSIDIIIDKIDEMIEVSIKYYCKEGNWPVSEDDILRFTRNNADLSRFKSIKFTKQSDKRLDIYFDFHKFNYDSFFVDKYKGYSGISIQKEELCTEKNYVEINVTEFDAYIKGKREKKKNPIDFKTPVIIKFHEFHKRTISNIQFGYQI